MAAVATENLVNGWNAKVLIGRDYTPLMTEVYGISKIVLSLGLFTVGVGHEISNAIQGNPSTGLRSFQFFSTLGIRAFSDGVLDVTAFPQLGAVVAYHQSCRCIRATHLTDWCKRHNGN